MASDESEADAIRSTSGRVAAAWAVHVYTASGAVLGLLALDAIARGSYAAAFGWMFLATFIDATDGWLARKAEVKKVLPRFDGARLDDIVDYLNYVIVPLMLATQVPGILPAGTAGLAIAAVPALASGYGFCQMDAKTDDHFFTGFPSYWNVVVFYLYVLRLPAGWAAFTLLAFSVLVFVPIRYLYPSRGTIAQRLTVGLGVPWLLMLVALLLQLPEPSQMLAVLSLFYPAYYLAMSFHVHFNVLGSASPPDSSAPTGPSHV